MAQAKAQFATSVSARARAAPKSKPTILIADDSIDGREMLTTLLGLKGYDVLSVENGLQAVEVAKAEVPDLILMDLQLPKLSGLEVVRKLRLHPQLKQTPIIIVSGYDPVRHRQSALDAGCNDYLLKPIDFDHLDAILNHSIPLPTSARPTN